MKGTLASRPKWWRRAASAIRAFRARASPGRLAGYPSGLGHGPVIADSIPRIDRGSNGEGVVVDDLTRRRLEHNEALFRAVNEEIDAQANSALRRAFVCECADPSCTETIMLTHEQYRHIRADPSHFGIVPGHVRPEVERVVERHASHFVVEKPQLARPNSELSST
jgi:hypothetical protein